MDSIYIITGTITGYDFRPAVHQYVLDHETDHYFFLKEYGQIIKKRKDAADLHYARDVEGLTAKLRLLKQNVLDNLQARITELESKKSIHISDVSPEPYKAEFDSIHL